MAVCLRLHIGSGFGSATLHMAAQWAVRRRLQPPWLLLALVYLTSTSAHIPSTHQIATVVGVDLPWGTISNGEHDGSGATRQGPLHQPAATWQGAAPEGWAHLDAVAGGAGWHHVYRGVPPLAAAVAWSLGELHIEPLEL